MNRSAEKHGGLLGTAVFLGVSVSELMTYRNRDVVLTIDGVSSRRRVQQVVIANGRCFGGGMRIAPAADPADGLLEVVVVGDISRFGALRAVPRLFRGTHLGLAAVEVAPGADDRDRHRPTARRRPASTSTGSRWGGARRDHRPAPSALLRRPLIC